jgi:hypothetical protein
MASSIFVLTLNCSLTFFGFWEDENMRKLFNILLMLCCVVDLLYFLDQKDLKLELLDFIGFLLPNMFLFLNLDQGLKFFSPQDQGK